MFCFRCGAEVRMGVAECPHCGQVVTSAWREATSAAQPDGVPAQVGASGVMATVAPAIAAPASGSNVVSVASVSGAGLTARDLDGSGLPRDVVGRTVLFATLAMGADLVAPWFTLGPLQLAPVQLGPPVVIVLALLTVAAVPTIWAPLRSHPIWRLAPLVIGVFGLGAMLALWWALSALTPRLAGVLTGVGTLDLTASPPADAAMTFSPNPGFLFFVLGCLVLALTGHAFASRARLDR